MEFAIVMAVITAFIAALCGIAIVFERAERKTKLAAVDPEKVLAERFARGEIDESEYSRRLSVLRLGPPLDVVEYDKRLEPPRGHQQQA